MRLACFVFAVLVCFAIFIDVRSSAIRGGRLMAVVQGESSDRALTGSDMFRKRRSADSDESSSSSADSDMIRKRRSTDSDSSSSSSADSDMIRKRRSTDSEYLLGDADYHISILSPAFTLAFPPS
ncbi:uncharacterized protein [Argopecten irradians]|uniref:uncharacterized protein n=1 Tax=Argopecten irradians TaxID=31199 RepID=UPI0037224201